jgi:predicted molibdopterin-dependent oxidoreductase YjgC
MVKVTIDDSVHDVRGNERLIDLLNRIGTKLAQVCYHPQLGPIQTCDTCLLETNGQLVRACGTDVSDGMTVSTQSAKTFEAQRQAFDRILSNHVLYCTVCDNIAGADRYAMATGDATRLPNGRTAIPLNTGMRVYAGTRRLLYRPAEDRSRRHDRSVDEGLWFI